MLVYSQLEATNFVKTNFPFNKNTEEITEFFLFIWSERNSLHSAKHETLSKFKI